jgi:menaquinone-dependent protoporphyrinogen oxidase
VADAVDVFIGYASAFGSTAGIAERIGDRLRSVGRSVTVAAVDEQTSAGFEPPAAGVVLGSAVHDRHWLPTATAFASEHARQFATRPVWLFSVSSVGDEGSFFAPSVAGVMRRARHESREIVELRAQLDVRDHRNFAGAIEREHWSTAGRAFFRLVGGTYGDHRHWADVDLWADGIARACTPPG